MNGNWEYNGIHGQYESYTLSNIFYLWYHTWTHWWVISLQTGNLDSSAAFCDQRYYYSQGFDACVWYVYSSNTQTFELDPNLRVRARNCDETTLQPTEVPTDATQQPTNIPSDVPTNSPSILPSYLPSMMPSINPSDIPTGFPSGFASGFPSRNPTRLPTKEPTDEYICCQGRSDAERYERRCNLLQYINHCTSRYHARRCVWDPLNYNCSVESSPESSDDCYCTHDSIATRKKANCEKISAQDVCISTDCDWECPHS